MESTSSTSEVAHEAAETSSAVLGVGWPRDFEAKTRRNQNKMPLDLIELPRLLRLI